LTNLSAQNDIPEIDVMKLDTHLNKLVIGSVNVVASVGQDGVLLSDSGFEDTAEALKTEIKKLGSDDIRFIINTHWHSDHVGGNKAFGKDATIIAHHNVRKLLSEDQALEFWQEEYKALPEYALPHLTFSDRLTIHFNGEAVDIIHLPGGHTDGDIIVYFKKANVLHMGDLLFSNGFPAVDFENGGSVRKFAENLRWMTGNMPPDVKIIAGHGPDMSIDGLDAYREMLLSTLNIIQEALKDGMDLDEMKQAEILKEWQQWGEGYFTCDEWTEIVYSSLTHKNEKDE
jgi:glyoxylase-like metal-dependent hydrolase (beta-lactamase superfamily II)